MYEKLHFDMGYFQGGHTIKENTLEFLRYYIFDTQRIFAPYNYIQTTLGDQLETSTE